MLNGFLTKNSYYQIFTKDYKQSTHIYSQYKAKNAEELKEVEKNRLFVINELGAKDILILKQVHGDAVVDADKQNNFASEIEGDSSVTTKPGLVLAIQTADCVPVLLSSESSDVIGASHCGWRSSKMGILSKVIAKMQEKGAKDIKALIGPAIQQASYEVDQNYYEDFLSDSKEYGKFFIPSERKDRYMFDLPAFVEFQLITEGVQDITKIPEDTYSLHERYPSYRRNTHNGTIYKKNILSTIIIR